MGRDSDNHVILSRLKAEGLDSNNVLLRDGLTDESIIYLSQDGENCIVSTDLMAKSIEASDVNHYVQGLVQGDILLMQGNLLEETTAICIRTAHLRGARVVLNLAPIECTYKRLWSYIHFLVVNEIEISILSGRSDPQEAAEYLVAHGIETVITTLGEQGAMLVDRHDGVTIIPAPEVSTVDTTGAGDVFTGVFAAGLAMSLSVVDACKWAVRAASLSVTRRGTLSSFPSPGEMVLLRQNAMEGCSGGAIHEFQGKNCGNSPR